LHEFGPGSCFDGPWKASRLYAACYAQPVRYLTQSGISVKNHDALKAKSARRQSL
jgi:hypothetical protein